MKKLPLLAISLIMFFSVGAIFFSVNPCSADQSDYVDAEQDGPFYYDEREEIIELVDTDAQADYWEAMDAIVPKALPNPDDYEIIFTDRYSDRFYLNLVEYKSGYHLYRGIFNSIYGQFHVIAIYRKSEKTLLLTAQYRNATVFCYHVKETSDTDLSGQ